MSHADKFRLAARLPPLRPSNAPAPAAPAQSTPAAIDHPAKLAADIVLAGRRRRGEAPCAMPEPPVSPAPIEDPAALAAQIVAAAAKARSRT